jgi:hypothetical protein
MLNTDYFLAAPLEYKKIWLVRIEETALRGHVEKDLKEMVKGLCDIYGFSYRKIHSDAVFRYNKKVTFKMLVSNTILNFRFRYFYIVYKIVKLREKLSFRFNPFAK